MQHINKLEKYITMEVNKLQVLATMLMKYTSIILNKRRVEAKIPYISGKKFRCASPDGKTIKENVRRDR